MKRYFEIKILFVRLKMTITVFIAHFNQHSRFLVCAVNINEAQKKGKRIKKLKIDDHEM
jgi:hypothetical protein